MIKTYRQVRLAQDNFFCKNDRAYFNALNNTTFEFILLILKFLSYNNEFGPLMAISHVLSLNLNVLSTAQDQLK